MLRIRTLRTIRYLKIDQVTGQVRKLLRPFWERADRFFQTPAPELSESPWEPHTSFLAPRVQDNAAENIKAGRLAFLKREEAIGWPPDDRALPTLPKLWQYNLHTLNGAAPFRVHIHPRCRIKSQDSHKALVEYDAGSFQFVFTGQRRLTQKESFYCPKFGRKEPSVAVAFTMEGKASEGRFTVSPT